MRAKVNISFILSILLLFSGTACIQSQEKKKLEPNMLIQMDTSIHKSDKEWKEILSKEQYYILREKGTEQPYSGKLLMVKDKGVYRCSACGNPLFSSDAKFDSHCGWPSFDRDIKAGTIITAVDSTLGVVRTEIMCGKCGGHLGHVFNDGPTNTGLRYCVNSLSLEFIPEAATDEESAKIDTITLGAGCFWCVEAIFQRLKGVISVESGYSGGNKIHPSYEDVCSGTTMHAEVVQLSYNTDSISLEEILEVFFAVHDPTSVNRQGNDAGTQYRSAIFYRTEEQKMIAEKVINNIRHSFESPIATTLEKFHAFYKAEDYHQNYYNENSDKPYCRIIIMPKLRKFEKLFKEKISE